MFSCSRFTTNDPGNIRLRNAELGSQGVLAFPGCVASADRGNGGIGQCCRTSLARSRGMRLFPRIPRQCAISTFAHHVSGVVGVCAEEEMGRVATRWIVTVMANEDALRDRAIRQLPSAAMRALASVSAAGDAVGVAATALAGPFPARIDATRPIDLIPETAVGFGALAQTGARAGAIAPQPTPLRLIAIEAKPDAAHLAGARFPIGRDVPKPAFVGAELSVAAPDARKRKGEGLATVTTDAFAVRTRSHSTPLLAA